jgi:hypothetical protein
MRAIYHAPSSRVMSMAGYRLNPDLDKFRPSAGRPHRTLSDRVSYLDTIILKETQKKPKEIRDEVFELVKSTEPDKDVIVEDFA